MNWFTTIWNKPYCSWTLIDGLIFGLLLLVAYFVVWKLFFEDDE